MFDKEILRNQQLIEERIEYENDFIFIEGIIKSEELDYYTTPQFEEYYCEVELFEYEEVSITNFDGEFEFEDYLEQLRDEQLIAARLNYEMEFFSQIPDDAFDDELISAQIKSFEDDYAPDYDYFEDNFTPDYDCFEDYQYYNPYEDHYIEEHNVMESAYCGGNYMDYIPNDDVFDRIDGCDYPEGPEENLNGIKFFNEYLCPEIEFFDECPNQYDFQQYPDVEYVMENEFGEYLVIHEENSMEKLIKEHIAEEKEFLKFAVENEVPDEHYLPSGVTDIIFC